MSPEQAAAEKVIDGRSDIYSLACVVFEMLAGEPPFTASNARTLVAKHIHERPPSIRTARPDLPEHIERALFIALAKSPADRFRTADEFVEALEDPSKTAEWRLPTWPRQSVGSRRVLVAGLVTLAIVAGAMVAYRRDEPAPPELDPAHIAVAYFGAPPNDSALSAVATGLTRDLIGALQQIPELTVISPDGVQALVGATPDSMARSLHVGTIVSGTVDRRLDSIQVEFRIIEPRTAVQRGSVALRYPASKFLGMRDSVVRGVAAELRARLGPIVRLREWRSRTRSDKAWELRQLAPRSRLRSDDAAPPRRSRVPPRCVCAGGFIAGGRRDGRSDVARASHRARVDSHASGHV
jgi:serine/threonine-protein kinase